MTDNPYKAPESNLEITLSEDRAQFYVVSIKKFAILFFLTLGLYIVYWFYKNWKEYKEYNGKNIWPIPRAIFSIFFVNSLFNEVQYVIKGDGKTFNWNPRMLAVMYILLSIVGQVLDRMSMKEIGSPYTDLLSISILPLTYVVLVKAQSAINISQNDPEGYSNGTFTVANYIWIALGGVFWLLTVFGFLTMFGFINVE